MYGQTRQVLIYLTMGFISEEGVSSISMSEVTGQLARIHSQADGDAAVALLDDDDRSLLNSAINSYAKQKGISISVIAKELGIGRTYLYNLLDSNQIELNRLRIIQDYLGVNILPQGTIELFLADLREKLSSKCYNSDWASKCNSIYVNKFYLLEFLLPEMESQTSWWKHLSSLSRDYNKSIFGDHITDENFKFSRMIQYIKDLDVDYYDELAKFDADLKGSGMWIPIDPMCNFWFDIEEELPESIWEYIDSLVSDFEKDLERETNKKKKKDLEEIIAYHNKELREAIEKCHEDFFKQFDKEYQKIESARKKVFEYCSTNNRLAKKQTYWPLEILEFAENLEENTISRKEIKAKLKSKK